MNFVTWLSGWTRKKYNDALCNFCCGQCGSFMGIAENGQLQMDAVLPDCITMRRRTIKIGILERFKAKKTAVDWSSAYVAIPKFYRDSEGNPFGAIALTEGAETVLPRSPQAEYQVDGKPVENWRMVLISTTKDTILGDVDYQTALRSAEKYAVDRNPSAILVRGLSLMELEALK